MPGLVSSSNAGSDGEPPGLEGSDDANGESSSGESDDAVDTFERANQRLTAGSRTGVQAATLSGYGSPSRGSARRVGPQVFVLRAHFKRGAMIMLNARCGDFVVMVFAYAQAYLRGSLVRLQACVARRERVIRAAPRW